MTHLKLGQVSAMNMHYQRVSFTSFLDSLVNLGISSFELWAGAPHYFNPESDPAIARNLKSEVEARQLSIVCLTPEQCVYPYNIASADRDLRRISLDYFTSYIRQAAGFGVNKILLTSGWGLYDENPKEAWDRCLEAIFHLLKQCEKEGVTIAFEILQKNETNLVNDFDSLMKVMDAVVSDYFTCCLDTVPVAAEGQTLEDYFRRLGSRISHIHLNDGTPAGHLTWGDGSQDLAAHLKVLDRYAYSGPMVLEIGASRYFQQPEKALRQGMETLARNLAP